MTKYQVISQRIQQFEIIKNIMQDSHKKQKTSYMYGRIASQREDLYIKETTQIFKIGQVIIVRFSTLENIEEKFVGQNVIRTFLIQKMNQCFEHQLGTKERNGCASMALNHLINYLNSDGEIAIFYGTNTTKQRRNMVQCQLLQQCQNVQTLWTISICDDIEVIQNNIKLTELNNPDYISMSSEKAPKDFLGRIKIYEEVYQKIDLDEKLSFIKLINIGEDIQIHKVKGYLFSKLRIKNQIHWLTSTMKRATHTADIVCNILRINYVNQRLQMKLMQCQNPLYMKLKDLENLYQLQDIRLFQDLFMLIFIEMRSQRFLNQRSQFMLLQNQHQLHIIVKKQEQKLIQKLEKENQLKKTQNLQDSKYQPRKKTIFYYDDIINQFYYYILSSNIFIQYQI
ncbi:unnamed protein product [Paramecium primaurelia]|uniref:6-phosphofructo-2-kinase domain-containing protein n=1 Tax=Paramecium primaurelia TaxID=5886 RepID=A0A8S1LSV4_PARPR|nr:unnamed protein product [Paramecium primaurelia]